MRRSNLMCGSMLSVPRASPLPGPPADPWAPKGPADIIEDINRALAEERFARITAAAFA